MAIPNASFRDSLGGRLLILFLLCLFLGSRHAAAQNSVPDLSRLSPCPLSCFYEGTSRSGCSTTDSACQCKSSVMADIVTTCVLEDCTMQEGLDMARFTAQNCNLPHESQSRQIVVIISSLFAVSVVFVSLRVVSKLFGGTFFVEDYLIIVAVILLVAPTTILLYMCVQLGFGSHIWDIQDGALIQILRLFYVSEILYVGFLALIKVSLVNMYLRIFWAYLPFKLACHGALLFIILPTAAVMVVTILSCQPIAYFWDRDIPDGTCLDVSALAYANSGFALAQDAALIALPVMMLWSLNMSRKKKLFIGTMFAMGSIGLIATIVRLRTLYVFGSLKDPTFDYIPVVYWTAIELTAGMAASCMPAVRTLLERFFKVFHLNTNHSEVSSGQIQMERQRRPTAEVADPLESPMWKNEVWDEDSHRMLFGPRSELMRSLPASPRGRNNDGGDEA